MDTIIHSAAIPDSKLARTITEYIRDNETELLFNHSSRVYHFGAIAGIPRSLCEDHRAECCRRQKHDLAVLQMRSKQASDIRLCESGGGAQDQFGTADGLGDICRHQRQFDVVTAVVVLHQDARAGGAMCSDRLCIAAPEPDLMSRQREIARGGERAVSPTQNRNLQDASPCARTCASSCLSRKCWTFPSAVRGRSVTKTMSRGIL